MARTASKRVKQGKPALVRAEEKETTVASEAPGPEPADAESVAPGPQPAKRQAARWFWAAAALIFAAYAYHAFRSFHLKPLDSEGTLRPLLYPVYAAFIRWHRFPFAAGEAWKKWCGVVTLIPAALALWNVYSARGVSLLRGRADRALSSRALFFASIAAALAVCRFPLLLAREFNPDESQFIVAAQKLFTDPLFFRSVDCGSTGPGNIFPLMIPAVAGFSPDYASSRVIGLILVFFSLYFLYRAFAEFGAEHMARVAIVPGVVFFSFLSNYEFVHYSSEHVPMLLTALALFACARLIRRPERYGGVLAALGVLAGLAFFSKMQSVPIVGAVGIVGLARVLRSEKAARFWRPCLFYFAGAAALPAVNAAVCAATGVWDDFLEAYVMSNVRYPGAVASKPLPSELHQLASVIATPREFQFLLLGFVVVLTWAIYRTLRRKPRSEYLLFVELAALAVAVVAAGVYLQSSALPEARSTAYAVGGLTVLLAVVFLIAVESGRNSESCWFGLLSGAALFASVCAVYAPHRMFPHYLLLLSIPVCCASGWLLMARYGPPGPDPAREGRWTKLPGLSLALAFLAVAAGCARYQLGYLGSYDNFTVGGTPTIAVPGSLRIRELTKPGASMVVWGWNSEIALGAGRVLATHDTSGAGFVHGPGAIDVWRRERFLRDMQRRPADVFVEALITSCCGFHDRNQRGFELDAPTARYIYSHYLEVAEWEAERFYLRRDLVPSGRRPCPADAVLCYDSTRAGLGPLAPIRMPEHGAIELEFTPLLKQAPRGTVFRIEGTPGQAEGLQLQYVAGDRYRLSFGAGQNWTPAGDVELPAGKPAFLEIEIKGRSVAIRRNGEERGRVELPGRMAESTGPILLGSSPAAPNFAGAIDSFAIRKLGAVTGGRL